MMWEGRAELTYNATHFLVPPPKPDPFEVWWGKWGFFWADKDAARQAWNAAREAMP